MTARSPQDEAFPAEVRRFFAEAVEPGWRTQTLAGVRLEAVDYIAWQKRLASRGWGAPTWPVEHGGTGWSQTQLDIFEDESALAGAPQQAAQGLDLIGPILMTYGSEEQKRRYLPRIVSGEDFWCQGYSEPGAGSDLAALTTRAVRVSDGFVVTGHKTWTSYAHAATHMFCLARTGAGVRGAAGVSMILIDMSLPGVTVRPIRTIDGRIHVNEVFLDAVRAPASDLVGEEGEGWACAKRLLDRERASAAANLRRLGVTLDGVEAAAGEAADGSERLLDEPAFRRRIAALRIDLAALRALSGGGAGSTAAASLVKVLWSELLQAIADLQVEVYANRGEFDGPLAGAQALAMQAASYARAATIYGGSSEIQRTVIARSLLASG